MNFAVDLLMACVFFRFIGVRVGGIDVLPDCLGVLLAILAIVLLRRREEDFRFALTPAALLFFVSLAGLYNFMPDEQNLVYAALYILSELAYLALELWLYRRLFAASAQMYRAGVTRAQTRAVGIVCNLAVWWGSSSVEAAAFTPAMVVFWVYYVLYFFVAALLIYQLYLQKPKFHDEA